MTRLGAPLFGNHGNDLVVATALIWAALIVAVSSTVQGTAYLDRLLPVLVVTAASSIVLLVVGVRKLQRPTDR